MILENNCFQSHESHHLSSNIGKLAHLLFHENPTIWVIVQEIKYDEKDKVKTTVKDKIKKSINSSRKYCLSGREPKSISLRIKILSVVRFPEREESDI